MTGEEPDWRTKIIGAGSDGASVNMGRNNSVSTRLKAEGREYLVFPHCVAHRLELAVASAIKEVDHYKTLQDVLKALHKHYHYSPKALRELRAVAQAMEEKVIKPTRLSGTRWVPHIHKACENLVTSFSVIATHFDHVGQLGPGENYSRIVQKK